MNRSDVLTQSFVTVDGDVERPVGASMWDVPALVELAGDRIVWRDFDGGRHPSRVYARPGLLTRFLGLADAPSPHVLRYARKWGVLGLCRHGWPADHGRLASVHGSVCYPEGEVRPYDSTLSEPVGAWRHYARQAAAILRIAGNLTAQQPGAPNDWATVAEWSGSYRTGARTWARWWNWPGSLEHVDQETGELPAGTAMSWMPLEFAELRWLLDHQQRDVAGVIDEWLTLGSARVAIAWNDEGPALTLDSTGLFGALACQLMLLVGRPDGLAFCSACHRPYAPKRRPAAGRANYCEAEACSKVAAARNASLKYSRKKRAHSLPAR